MEHNPKSEDNDGNPAAKNYESLKGYMADDLELDEKYRVPVDLLHDKEELNDSWSLNSSVEVIQ